MPLDRPQSVMPDYSVRPLFRLLGSLLCGGMALMFFYDTAALLQRSGSVHVECSLGRGRWTCELGNLMLAALPVAWRNPTLAIVAFVLGAAFIFFIWWLLRPLFLRSTAQQPPKA